MLAVIAIVLVLMALLAPLLARAKAAAKVTDNIAKMKQLGQAFNIYIDECGGWPEDARQLINHSRADRQLWLSNIDEYRGLATEHCIKIANNSEGCTNTKRSFFMFSDFGLKLWWMKKEVLPEQGVGWLVDPYTMNRRLADDMELTPDPIMWRGRYRRLALDGSVTTRSYTPMRFMSKTGLDSFACHPALLLSDPSEEAKNRWLKPLLQSL